MFGEAQDNSTRQGQERLRRPAELPAESDVQHLRNYCQPNGRTW